ncbi:MAG TPA: glycosyltransferase family 1 protein [Vicinamibacterales bacterium]|jgi:glycosyltransferase involved in cell wall biosynthesis|nr:glycosyltransferase family 1 protein [Vicinamibacterales bacterium]
MSGPLRVAIIADYLEEAWPSMDLVADMLLEHLRREHAGRIAAELVRPPMPRRLTRLPMLPRKLSVIDRAAARQWDYTRKLRKLAPFDVYHVVDHTYAHLVHGLPAGRSVVTCHDVDAFRSILQPAEERRSLPFRWMSRRILDGLLKAAHVPCDSEATRDALIELASFPPGRLSVIPNGTDTGGSDGDAFADFEAARLLGPRHGVELLHVGSTIERKRIDLLLEVFAAVRAVRPDARLVRVGGPFSGAQRAQARDLGIADAIAILPFVDRATLGAVYRRAALTLLPSEREGFGLPLVESLASGTPMVASDIPVLRELGADAVVYCAFGNIPPWRDAILALLAERERDPDRWRARKARGVARASEFSWSHYAARVAEVYDAVAARPSRRREMVDA